MAQGGQACLMGLAPLRCPGNKVSRDSPQAGDKALGHMLGDHWRPGQLASELALLWTR